MQTQIGGAVAIIVAVPFVLALTAGAVAAALPRPKGSDADETWAAIRLRGGVTAPSPWHSRNAPINAPALVEVKPRCKQTLPVEFPEPVPASVPASVLAPVRVEAGSASVGSVSAVPAQPERSTSEAIDEITKEAILSLKSQGLSKTKIIKQVFGASPGGNAKYKSARAMYETVIEGVATNA